MYLSAFDSSVNSPQGLEIPFCQLLTVELYVLQAQGA